MGNDLGYRLNQEEIIFLSASLTQAKVIFGLRNKPSPPEQPEARWERVKNGLVGNKIILEQSGKPTLCSDLLGQMIYAISHPKTLVAIRPYEEPDTPQMAQAPLTRFYIRGQFAVTVENDVHAEDYYTVNAYDNSRDVNELLGDLLCFDDDRYAFKDERIQISLTDMEKVTEAVKEKKRDVACNILHEGGLSAESAADVYGALASNKKSHLASYVIFAFDPAYHETDGRRTTQEVLLYGGAAHLWRISVTGSTVTVSVTTKDAVWQDMQVISRLIDFV